MLLVVSRLMQKLPRFLCRLQMHDLIDVCASQLMRSLTSTNLAERLVLADRCHAPGLKVCRPRLGREGSIGHLCHAFVSACVPLRIR